jgi:hypothetical protein
VADGRRDHRGAVVIVLKWTFVLGAPGIQADLSYAEHYVISHRPERFNVSYRPPGEHHHVGCYLTLVEAKRAARAHFVSRTEGHGPGKD